MHDFGDWGSDYAVGDIYTRASYCESKETYRTLIATLEHETEKAYLLGQGIGDKYIKFWLPKKHVMVLSTEGSTLKIKVPSWIKGLRAKG